MPKKLDAAFIKKVEESHFRTCDDTGANDNAMFIWNIVRQHVGLPVLHRRDLPAWCLVHKKYHVINTDYECVRGGEPEIAKKTEL